MEAAAATGELFDTLDTQGDQGDPRAYSGISVQSQSRNGSFAWSTIGPAVERMVLRLTMNVDGHAQA